MGVAAAPIAIAATLASGAMSAIGQSNAAAAQASQANYQAEIARRNQQLMEQNARRAEEQGRVDEQNQRFKTSSIIGGQRAALASQGADVNTGSPLDIQTDTARAGEADALTIRHNAALQAYGYRVQATGAEAQAGLYGMQSASATANLPFAIGSTLLGTASSVAGKWSSWQKNGTVG